VFQPRVQIVQVGRPLIFANLEPFVVNFHTIPIRNIGANVTLSPMTQWSTGYSKPEKSPVRIMSVLHTWQRAYHVVLNHPWGAVTDRNGSFSIPRLPPGNYELVIWHERADDLNHGLNVTVRDDQPLNLKLTYPATRFR
jgi:hypothetical protein